MRNPLLQRATYWLKTAASLWGISLLKLSSL